jgi:hypothetical protein
MALTNAEKQARWRERNMISLTDGASDVAEKLIEMGDQAKLRKIAKFVNDHLKHPDRTQVERAIALGKVGMAGLNGPLSKTAALAKHRAPAPDHSYRVEVVTADGQRWGSGVRLATEEEAQLYAERYATHEVEGYVTSDIIRCDEPPVNSITRKRKGSKDLYLGFADGTCGSLSWVPLTDARDPSAVIWSSPRV